MTRSRRPRLSARVRRLWLTSAAVTLGLAAVSWTVWRLDSRHRTDLADARTNVTATFEAEARARQTPVRFTEVAAAAGLRFRHGPPQRHRALPEDTGSGLAWGDFDGDGWPDLFLVNHPGIVPTPGWTPTGNRLFRNQGDGTFEDVAARAGVADPGAFGMGATWVDYDGDGHVDLHVTCRGPNRLFRNRGDGTFVDVAAAAGVADPGWGTGTAWGDYDRDGRIDFYLCNYVAYDTAGREAEFLGAPTAALSGYEVPFTLNPNSYDPQPNRLFRNRGDGTFEEVAERCGVANAEGRSFSAAFADLDGDGWLDLYVTNDVSANRLYRNLGGEAAPGEPVAFIDLSAVTGTADPRGSMGLALHDVGATTDTADDLPDLFFTNWVSQENAFYQSLRLPGGGFEYRDRARALRLGELSIEPVGWGCAVVDLDLDGRGDLAVVNGSTLERTDHPLLLRAEPLFLFVAEDGGFRDVAPLAGAATAAPYCSRGLAAADYDGDGDSDLAVAINQGEPLLLRNDTAPLGRHSLALRLAGTAAQCFGARIEIHAAGRRQLRWWGADVSYLSQHAAELTIGLGTATTADKVVVHWTDGTVTETVNVPAGRLTLAHRGAVQSPSPPR